MNITTDIKFNSDLIENEIVTLTYSGYLFKNNSEQVTVVFGYGDDWNNLTEQVMEKNENGFTTNIKLLYSNKLNFCFKNSNNMWDNNYNSNFIVPIQKKANSENFIINENYIVEVVKQLLEIDISKISNESQNVSATTVEDFKVESINNYSYEYFLEPEKKHENISSTNSTYTDDFEDITYSDFYNDVEDYFSMDSLVTDVLSPIVNDSDNSKQNNSEEYINSLVEEILSPMLSSEENISNNSDIDINIENIDKIIETNEDNDDILNELEINDNLEILENNNINGINIIENIDTMENIEDVDDIEINDNENINIASDINNSLLLEDTNQTISEIENSFADISEVASQFYTNNTNFENKEDNFENVEHFDDNITDNISEKSLIEDYENEVSSDNFNEQTSENVTSSQTALIVSTRGLSKFYKFKKKLRLAFYKLFNSFPKLSNKTE